MQCQFPGCSNEAQIDILYGRGHVLTKSVCVYHMADEYVSNIKMYSGCRISPIGMDKSAIKPDILEPKPITYQAPEPSGYGGCGNCNGCK